VRRHNFGLGHFASGLLVAFTAIVTTAQQPVIQNGRVEVRQTTGIDRELAALDRSQPVWAAWRVPIVAGRRAGCCVYSDDTIAPNGVRGCFVETQVAQARAGVPQINTPHTGVPLEAGTGLVMLVRMVNGRVERMRTLGDDCPLDAGGRTVYWLQGPTPAESLTFLDTLIRQAGPSSTTGEQRLRDSAISAAALHADAGADALLDRLAASDADTNVRRLARTHLGSARGAHGFATLRRLLEAERLPEIRRQLVGSLGQTREPGTAALLLGLARSDTDASIRADAAYWLPQRGTEQDIRNTIAIVNADTADVVKRRGVQGLARASNGDVTALLLELARTSQSVVVKREAVSALGRSKDPRATAYLEGLLR
jgi:hypothetical protein